MGLRKPLVAVFGVAATLFGVGLLLAPSLVYVQPIEDATTAVTEVDPATLMFAGGLVLGLYFVFVSRTGVADYTWSSDVERQFEKRLANPPEAVTADRQFLAADTVSGDVHSAIRSGGPHLASVQALLYETATSAYAEAANTSEAAAENAIEGGTWTNDRLAASFLAGSAGPETSRRDRLRLWLRPQKERHRRIDRTLAAIEQLQHET
jgi:hypothetical protein